MVKNLQSCTIATDRNRTRLSVALLIAPVSPFFADRLYTDLTSVTKDSVSSVHLALFPVAGESDSDLEERMKLAQDVTSMVQVYPCPSLLPRNVCD